MDEVDRRQLRLRIRRLTWMRNLFLGGTVLSLAVYTPAVMRQEVAPPRGAVAILYVSVATAIVITALARHEARADLRSADAAATQLAETVVAESAMRALFAVLSQISGRMDEDAVKADRRDGRLYQQIRFAHNAMLGLVTDRDLERDTEQLPRAVGGDGVYGVATVAPAANLTVLPSAGTVAAMRRLARKVTDLD